MRVKQTIGRFAYVAGAAIALIVVVLFGLSYYDVRASVGPTHISLVAVTFDWTHLLEARWRVGEYDPEHDMPGQYVYWTLRPRKVTYVK